MLDKLDILEPEDRAWAQNWIRHASGDWGKLRDGADAPPGNLHTGLNVTRHHRPHAFQWLVLNHPIARTIAAKAGWDDPPKTKPTEDEIQAVNAILKTLPQDPIRSRQQQLDALSGLPLRPSYLSPEQLQSIRKLNGGGDTH